MQSGVRPLGVDSYYLRLLTLPFLLRYISPFFLYSTLHRLRAQRVNSSVIILSLSFTFIILHLFNFSFTPSLFSASKLLHIFLNLIIQIPPDTLRRDLSSSQIHGALPFNLHSTSLISSSPA